MYDSKLPQNIAHVTLDSNFIYFFISCISLFLQWLLAILQLIKRSCLKWCIWENISAQKHKNMHVKVLA